MKKQLLSVLAALAFGSVVAQTPSPSWSISQNANFTVVAAGTRYLDAVNSNVVWACGYDGFAASRNYNWYARSINGGGTFNSGSIFPNDTFSYVLANMEGIDANTAWVSVFTKSLQAQGGIFRTTNGGANWVNMTAPGMFTNVASFCDVVSFLTPNNGIVIGDPVAGEYELWTTTNGGVNWTPVPGANIPNPTAQEFAIVDLYDKVGPNNLWFGTNKGRIYYTTNSGLNWSVSPCGPATGTVTEIAFASVTNGLAFVAVTTASTALFNTIDGGVTWNFVNTTDPDLGHNDLCGIPGTNIFASVDNNNQVISYSSDNGLTWTNWGGVGIPYLKVDFVDANTAWAGSFSDQVNPFVGGIWKYTGIISAFSMPINVCKTGATVAVSPVNLSTGAITNYSWTAGNSVAISAPTSSNPVLTFSTFGLQTITLTATNGLGVSVNFAQTINVLNCTAPVANFTTSPASLCNNVTFSVTSSGITGVPTPTYMATTTAPNSTVVPGNGSNVPTTFKFSTPGIYTITVTATNNYSTTVVTKTVDVKNCAAQANFVLSSYMLCLDGSAASAIITTTNTSVGGTTFTWTILPNAVTSVTVNNLANNNRKFTFDPVNGFGSYTITLIANNVSGATTYSTVVDVSSCAVGINENAGILNNIGVYPNPAHDQLNVALPASNETYKIKMINLIGAVVYEEKVVKTSKETIGINLANKPKGVYFLSVEIGTAKTVKKIIVE